MCNEFFKPTWKKAIGFLIINSVALLIWLLASYVLMSGWPSTVLTYTYLLLSPFGFLFKYLATTVGSWGVDISMPAVFVISLLQNLLEILWQYLLACFVVGAFHGKKAVILRAKKK